MSSVTPLRRRRIARVAALGRRGRAWWRRYDADAGMTTAEYAVGTIAACSFALVLIAVVKSGPIRSALVRVITTALGLAG